MKHNCGCRVGKTIEFNVFIMLSEDQETNPGGVDSERISQVATEHSPHSVMRKFRQ